jgi:hypothetical protein
MSLSGNEDQTNNNKVQGSESVEALSGFESQENFEKDEPSPKDIQPEIESEYPGPKSVALICIAIYLAMFLVSLVSRAL